MKINIDEILDNQGKTRYWLAKKTNIPYQTIKKICDGVTESIKFSIIESICLVLDCTPNEILLIDKENKNAN